MPDATITLPALASLTVLNAKLVLGQGVAAIRAGQGAFDLGALTTVDSSAVAVLLAWQRAAREAGTALRFEHVQPNLLSLATLYGVDAFLCAADPDVSAAVSPGAAAAEPHHH